MSQFDMEQPIAQAEGSIFGQDRQIHRHKHQYSLYQGQQIEMDDDDESERNQHIAADVESKVLELKVRQLEWQLELQFCTFLLPFQVQKQQQDLSQWCKMKGEALA